jgi:hypothetical protein
MVLRPAIATVVAADEILSCLNQKLKIEAELEGGFKGNSVLLM